MRFQNWDVLIFPYESKVPLQEFKTTCQVVQDTEFHQHNHPMLLPIVTSFIPGLPSGAAFRVSIHSWQMPETSRTIANLTVPGCFPVFDARLLVDGRVVGAKCFSGDGPWPSVIEFAHDPKKHGEFRKLEFPTFHRELLSQSYWNPGDELGRIKLIISEGFSAEKIEPVLSDIAEKKDPVMSDRVQNIVAFSFQHAPLDVLEQSNIAWPNPAMFRQASLAAPYLAPPQQQQYDIESPLPIVRYTTSATLGTSPKESKEDPFMDD